MPWVQAVAWSARNAMASQGRIDGLCMAAVLFQFPRLASHYKTTKADGRVLRPDAPVGKRGKPDIDKLLRAVLDGISDSGLWTDDSYCFAVTGMKIHVNNGQMTGAMCRVYPADDLAGYMEAVAGLGVIATGGTHKLWEIE
jgi:Holliday junction resolvase RusA-like endonuclease